LKGGGEGGKGKERVGNREGKKRREGQDVKGYRGMGRGRMVRGRERNG